MGASKEGEKLVRSLCESGDHRKAAEEALLVYGKEIRGFLQRTVGEHGAANEVFSDFELALFRGLAQFRWQSSLRTWAYRLAWNAWHHHREAPANDKRRREALTDLPEIAAKTRTGTAPWRKTDVKNALRRALDELLTTDQRAIYDMHVERRMTWDEVARVVEGEHADGKAIERRSAALRKWFETLKKRLVPLLKPERRN